LHYLPIVIVCHCRRVSDREIRTCVRQGAQTCHDVGEACGAGAECGGCHQAIEEIVHEEQAAGRVLWPLRLAG